MLPGVMSTAVDHEIQNISDFIPETAQVFWSVTNLKLKCYQTMSTKKAVLILGVVFSASLLIMAYLYYTFPQLEEKQYIKIPFNIKDAKNLCQVLKRYSDTNYSQVLMSISFLYIVLQMFGIPGSIGSISLSIICGFLYPFELTLAIICFCSAMGACLCYLISMIIERRLPCIYFQERINSYVNVVKKHNYIYTMISIYIMYLRISPLLPNWFRNVCATLKDVPIIQFLAYIFAGVASPYVVAIEIGQTLHELTSSNSS